MLAVVIADVSVEGEYTFLRRRFGTTGSALQALAEWLVVEQVDEVVMESTAQYWRPVWEVLEKSWLPKRRAEAEAESGRLHLAQVQSNRGARGRKRDYPDAERLVKRLMAQELTLSFVPEPEQRLWRTVMRRKNQLTRNKIQLRNRLECLLEEAHLKLSSLVSVTDCRITLISPDSRAESTIGFSTSYCAVPSAVAGWTGLPISSIRRMPKPSTPT
jgi:hypothetical protein